MASIGFELLRVLEHREMTDVGEHDRLDTVLAQRVDVSGRNERSGGRHDLDQHVRAHRKLSVERAFLSGDQHQ